jgi:hypothetical protein
MAPQVSPLALAPGLRKPRGVEPAVAPEPRGERQVAVAAAEVRPVEPVGPRGLWERCPEAAPRGVAAVPTAPPRAAAGPTVPPASSAASEASPAAEPLSARRLAGSGARAALISAAREAPRALGPLGAPG